MFVTIPKLLRSIIPETHGGKKDGNQEQWRLEKTSAEVQAHRSEAFGRIAAGAAGIWHSRRNNPSDRQRVEGSSRARCRNRDYGRRWQYFSRRAPARI